jgi:hypothetical protein
MRCLLLVSISIPEEGEPNDSEGLESFIVNSINTHYDLLKGTSLNLDEPPHPNVHCIGELL